MDYFYCPLVMFKPLFGHSNANDFAVYIILTHHTIILNIWVFKKCSSHHGVFGFKPGVRSDPSRNKRTKTDPGSSQINCGITTFELSATQFHLILLF